MYVSDHKTAKAEALFRDHGGMLRTSEALDLGIHPRTLYFLRNTGRLEQVSRGVYRLAELPPLEAPDLVAVATRVPDAVVCLISALSFHEITTEVPHEVHIALPRGTDRPTLDYPPIRVFYYSGPALTEGVDEHTIDGVPVKIYNAPKTVADAFKFRNKIGTDVAIDALKLCLLHSKASPSELMRYARVCRVDRVMQPYLEALT